jgi:hypothetical protein
MAADDLSASIEALRDKLERGELAGLGPIRLYAWQEVPDVERWVRAALQRVDYFRAPSPQGRAQYAFERRQLADELLRLRDRLNGIDLPPEERSRPRAF